MPEVIWHKVEHGAILPHDKGVILNPNQLVAAATKGSLERDRDIRSSYIEWCLAEHPDLLLIVVATQAIAPWVGKHQKLRGDRERPSGWCVVTSDNMPGAIIVIRKEWINAKR